MQLPNHSDRYYVAIDFEYANGTPGSICAFGLAFEDGSTSSGTVRLHCDAGLQENQRIHGISQEQTDSGIPFAELYAKLELILQLHPNAIFVAHDLKSDRRAWLAAQDREGLPVLPVRWVDSLPVARRELKNTRNQGGGGIKHMARLYGMAINHHDPVCDALVALQVILRNPVSNNMVSDG